MGRARKAPGTKRAVFADHHPRDRRGGDRYQEISTPPRSIPALFRLLGVALLAVLLMASPVGADDHGDDDDGHHRAGTATATADNDGFGAFLHRGTCEELGEKVDDLEALGDEPDDDGQDDHARVWERIGGDDQIPEPFWADDDDVDPALDALTGEGHVITVHETSVAALAVIACGAVAGEPDERNGLLVDLEEAGGSDYEGRAYLIADADDDEDDGDDDDGTEVFVGVWEVQPAGV